MDVFTLTVINAFIAVVVTTVLALQNKAERQFRYQRYFMLAGCCFFLNSSLTALLYAGYHLPYWVQPALSNTLNLSTNAALAAGIHRHLQLPGKRNGLLLIPIAAFLLHFSELAQEQLLFRMLIIIPAVILLNLWCISMLWRFKNHVLGKVYLAFIAIFSFNILQLLFRLSYNALYSQQLLPDHNHAMIQSVIFFNLTAFVILIFGCMIMLSHSQQRQALIQLSERDALTGLLNRRSLDLRLTAELHRAAREKLPTSFLLLDIDHFKQVNDNLGHTTGDAVIKHVAKIINELSRDYDVLFRYGGEEFLICLPNTDELDATSIANRIRETLAQRPITTIDTLTITVSIGLASTSNTEQWQVLLQQADQALYLAKQQGRNCVKSYHADLQAQGTEPKSAC